MKAITVTQENKANNPTLFSNRPIGSIARLSGREVINGLPNKYLGVKKVDGGYMYRTELHEQDGFFDEVIPNYDSATQYLGDLFFDEVNSVFTRPILDYSAQEISDRKQQQAIDDANIQKQQLIQQELEAQVIEQAQAKDDTGALNNQALFPMWEVGFAYIIGFKCQDFNNADELKLFKCIQAHTSQSDWKPKDVPALFTVVAYPGVIPDWVQPTGAQDAYNIQDQVYHDNPNDNSNIWLYESKINANTTEPGRDGTFDRWWQPIQLK